MRYLDKPMKGHTLIQAIARVNRVGGSKKNGFIIDYNGVLKSLCKALATFAQGDGKGNDQDILRDDTEAVVEYGQSIREAQGFLTGCGFNLDETKRVARALARLLTASPVERPVMLARSVS
jgi:type I restriction enzyme R subunit